MEKFMISYNQNLLLKNEEGIMKNNHFQAVGATYAFLSVLFGAFAAHALKDRLGIYELSIFDTAVRYQFFHALPLILLPQSPSFIKTKWSFLVGVIIFSGSLYIIALTGIKIFGAITPLGGLLFLFGWANLIYKFLKNEN